MALVKNPEHDAHEEKNQKQGKDENRTQHESFPAIGDRATSEHPLDNQLLGAVGGQHHHRAPQDAHPEIKGSREREVGIEPSQFAGRPSLLEGRRPAPFDKCWNIKKRKKSAGQKKTKLHGIGPDHRFDSANISIKQREADKN